MKKISLLTLFFCLTASVFAQNETREGPSSYFNGFQETSATNPDSAIYFLQKLAHVDANLMELLLHDSFAQTFLNKFGAFSSNDPELAKELKERNITLDSARKDYERHTASAKIILSKMSVDSNALIRKNAYPITAWVEAQNHVDNLQKLSEIGTNYLAYLDTAQDFYAERKARYGFLIYNILAKEPNLKPLAEKLFKSIYNHLKNHQITAPDNQLSRFDKEKRAWFRYMFAYANFIAAKNNAANKSKNLSFLKMAADYSPDTQDKSVSNAYYSDAYFLFQREKQSFEDDYLAALDDKNERFKTLFNISFKDPSYKAEAKSLYKGELEFNAYWLNEFNKRNQTAPVFSLAQIDDYKYTLNSSSNKWTLIDFWGTWCGPCRREHPDLEQLYQQTQEQSSKLNIITIACSDEKENVKQYMKQFKYNFPVAMANSNVEKDYNVASWPSKFLVSPQGKYIIIPWGVDWKKYIADYTN